MVFDLSIRACYDIIIEFKLIGLCVMATLPRKKLQADVESRILINSARRCPLCFHLNGDLGEKNGQIAHLDHDRGNDSYDNLVFMCMPHHSDYDSTTSQHKNYTLTEVKSLRARLYTAIESGAHFRSALGQHSPQQGAISIRAALYSIADTTPGRTVETTRGEIRSSLTNVGQQPVYPIEVAVEYERITFSTCALASDFPKKLEPGAYAGVRLSLVMGYGRIKNVWAKDSLDRKYYLPPAELAFLCEQFDGFVEEMALDGPKTGSKG